MDQQQNMSITQNLDTLFTNLEDFTKKEGVLGKPVTYGDKTLIPIVSVTLGYGSGNSNASANNNQQSTSGTNQGPGMGMGALGLGARISTEAVVVIDKDNVSMLPVSDKTNNQLMDKIPQILSSMGQNNPLQNMMGQGKQGQQAQQQGQQGQQQNQKQ